MTKPAAEIDEELFEELVEVFRRLNSEWSGPVSVEFTKAYAIARAASAAEQASVEEYD